MATQGFLFHWNGEFSSVSWFAVHILHGRLLIKKRTEQISVLLYEWTREKHNRSFGVAAFHVISTELRDQKFSASIVSTMAETTELIKLLADHIEVQRQQMEQQAQQHRVQMEQQAQQHRAEM